MDIIAFIGLIAGIIAILAFLGLPDIWKIFNKLLKIFKNKKDKMNNDLFDNFGGKIEDDEKMILYVSTGGTCRCAMANIITQYYCKEKNKTYKIKTMSVANDVASSEFMSENAQIVIKKHLDIHKYNISCSNHKTIEIHHGLAKRSDLILAMSMRIYNSLTLKYPDCKDKIQLFTTFFGLSGDIKDPFGKSVQVYDESFIEIKNIIKNNLLVIENNLFET